MLNTNHYPRIICLLPVRNGAGDLPGFLSSARQFCDAIVALDDGSTDETFVLLDSDPLVTKVLRHPRRTSYHGWHDAANRNELLAAAAELEPDWIISVDADERIDLDDAAALRAFVAGDALPGIGYGFRCYSMAADLQSALPTPIWVYRLFAWEPGCRFPDQALHFSPIPTNIPRRARIRTTLRIQHLGGSSAERRRARYEKYRQADPECRFWPDYSSLLIDPDPASYRPWRRRSPDDPVVFRGGVDAGSDAVVDLAPDGHAKDLTVVIVATAPSGGWRNAVASVDRTGANVEVLLACPPRVERVPGVDRVIELPAGVPDGTARNAALRSATGRWILFLDAVVSLEPGAISRLLSAHREGYALVTGAVRNTGTSVLGSAAFLARFGADQPGRAEGVMDQPVRWASYERQLLIDSGGFDECGAGGAAVGLHRELAWQGYLAFRSAETLLRFNGDALSARAYARDAAQSGSATARYFLEAYGDRGHVLDASFVGQRLITRLPRRIQLSRSRAARAKLGTRTGIVASAAEVAGVVGEWLTIAKPARGKALVLFGRPAGIALVIVQGSTVPPVIALVRFALREPFVRVVMLAPGLLVPGTAGEMSPLSKALGLDVAAGGAAQVSRFAVHDAVGRWLEIDIDDIVSVDGDWLAGKTRGAKSARQVLTWLHEPRTIAEIAGAREAEAGPLSTGWTRTSKALALLRLRRLRGGDLTIVAVGGDGRALDADDVSIARQVLEPETLRKPRNQRESLKRVEWA